MTRRRAAAPAPPSAADKRDPHLRLPRPLQVARMAEVAFIVVTSYFALLVPAGGQAAQMVRARLVFEAFAALAVLVALPRVPGPARIAAMVLAVFVLIGCLPALVLGGRALAGSGAAAAVWLSFLLSSTACASQAVVLGACLSVPRGTPGAE